MLLFTVLSLLALPSTLGGLVPRQEVDQLGCDASTEPTGEKMFAVSYTGSLCDQDKITTGGNDIDDQVCVKQPSTKSIRMPSGGGQRGIYCLQLYGDFNCNDLETSVSVKFVENDGICKTLDGVNDMGKPISTIFASYRWVKSCNGNCPRGPWEELGPWDEGLPGSST